MKGPGDFRLSCGCCTKLPAVVSAQPCGAGGIRELAPHRSSYRQDLQPWSHFALGRPVPLWKLITSPCRESF